MKRLLIVLLLLAPVLAFSQTQMRWERIKPISAQVENTNPLQDDILLIENSVTGAIEHVKVSSLLSTYVETPQTLSTDGTAGNISIEGGNTIVLNVNDSDSDPTNELDNTDEQTISTNGTPGNLSIENGNTITLNVDDADNDPTNELDNTDDQTLSWDEGARRLSIEDGNYVTISGGGSSTGETFDTITYTSHGLSAGDWFGYRSNAIIKCLADTTVNADVVGVVKKVIDANTFTYQRNGIYMDGTWVEGENYFLSLTTAGRAELDTQTYALNNVYLFLGTGTDKGLDINIDVGFVIDSLETPEITVYKFEKQLTTSENVVDIGYTVNSSTLVFVNGYITSDWTGSGTSVTLGGDIIANDYLVAVASDVTSLYSDVLAEDETVIALPFTMETTSLPFYNGTLLKSSQYSGSITFSLDVKENDNTIIKQ